MLSKYYSNLTKIEQADFLGKVIIMAQSEEWGDKILTLIWKAEDNKFFEKISPGDPSHPHIKDVDSPIENGPSSPQN